VAYTGRVLVSALVVAGHTPDTARAIVSEFTAANIPAQLPDHTQALPHTVASWDAMRDSAERIVREESNRRFRPQRGFQYHPEPVVGDVLVLVLTSLATGVATRAGRDVTSAVIRAVKKILRTHPDRQWTNVVIYDEHGRPLRLVRVEVDEQAEPVVAWDKPLRTRPRIE
jgi:hypothetical protein